MMSKLSFLLIASLFFMITSIVAGITTQHLQAKELTNDEYIEEYRDEVRDNRPSISYKVFEPAINFFKNIYYFIDTIVTVLYEKISSFFHSRSD